MAEKASLRRDICDGEKKSHEKSRGKTEVWNLDFGKVTKDMSPQRGLAGEGSTRCLLPQ